MRLRLAVRNYVLCPGNTCISAHRHTCVAVTVPHRQIHRAIRANADMAVYPAALSGLAVVGQSAWSITHAQGIAALAGSGPNGPRLGAVVNSLALVQWRRQCA